MSGPARIAVVGAGMAGLTAARGLASAGCEVVVFDKARAPGGRLSTRRCDAGAFDHGAQYFTCRSEDFRPVLDDWLSRGVAAPWEARIATLDRGSLGPTRDDTARYVGLPGMSALPRDMAAGLEVECGRRVERLVGEAGRWTLTFESGPDAGDFTSVLVATPAPQAAPLLADVSRFDEVVAGVEMEPCLAGLVVFERPLGLDIGGAFVARSPLAWVARNASKPERPEAECWVLHAGPSWSGDHLDDDPEQVADALLAAFAEALRRELPPVVFRTSHRWRYAQSRGELPMRFLWEPASGLGACGDWAEGGRVEGAFLSGQGLARAVLGEAGPAG